MKKKSIISIMLVLVMLVNLLPLGVITTQAASKIYPTTVHGTWDGSYQVSDLGSVDARKIRVCITKCTPSGEIEGNATLENGEYGKYVLKGNVDLETGEITFQGTEWIHNPGELSMLPFSGEVNADTLEISGLVNDTYDFSLKKISDNAESIKIDKDIIKLDYTGEYDGASSLSGPAVRRNIEIHIEKIYDNGYITGKAIVSASSKADAGDAMNASYNFSGEISFETASIYLQGHSWIDYPHNYTYPMFTRLDGYIDAENGRIIGTSSDGIWEMQAIDYEKIEGKKSGFTLGVDNNAFWHHNSREYDKTGFKGSTDYTISEELYKKLANQCGPASKGIVKMHMKDKWGGACYGMSATMGLLYNNYITLQDLTDSESATNYYTLPYPCNDKKLLDTINYYHLSQYAKNGGMSDYVTKTYHFAKPNAFKEWWYAGDGQSAFLNTLVNYTTSGHIGMLFYNIKNVSVHAVLVTGCEYDNEKEQYVVQMYDMNSVGPESDLGEFVYMYIEKDYSDFSMSDNRFPKDKDYNMVYKDWESMGDIIYSSSESTTNASIRIASEGDFKLVNNAGKYIQYKDGEFSGDMKIYDINFTYTEDSNDVNNEGSGEIVFEVDNFSTLDIIELGGAVDIEVCSQDELMALEAQGIDSAHMELGESMSISGDDYTFKAFVSTDAITDDEDGLVSFSGKATDDVVVTRSGQTAEISSNEKLADLKSVNYSSIYTHTVECPDSTSAKATAQEIVFTKLLGDCDNDGDLSILDATEIQRYLAVLTSKYDINYDVCDVDNDGDISVLDSTRIQMTLAGLI